MTWEDFLNVDIPSNYNGQVQTDIACPKCGRNIYLNSTIVLTTYPRQYRYWCSCGWNGLAHTKWMKGMKYSDE